MNRAFVKNLWREVGKTLGRYVSIFLICALGVAFFVGIRATSPDMKDAGDALFFNSNLADITVVSTSGLSAADIGALRSIEGIEAVRPSLFVDAMMDAASHIEANVRLYSMPIKEKEKYGSLMDIFPRYDIDPEPEYEMNILELASGRLPVSDREVALDAQLEEQLDVALGDEVTLRTDSGTATLRVVGFVYSPLYIGGMERGTSTIGNGSCDGFAYASGNAIGKLGTKLPIIGLLSTIYTRADIVVADKVGVSAFSPEYDALVSAATSRIKDYAASVSGTWYIQTRAANPGYEDYASNTDRIAAVGDVFPLIFFIVAALVCLTTMTRMVEEQRIEMGTLKALGYGGAAIAAKYLLYAMSACVLGGLAGALVGFKLFPKVILTAYSLMYRMPYLKMPFRADIALVAILSMVACTGAATLSASWTALSQAPSALMRPKAPKAGKRVFVERIAFIWKKLGFTAKVTLRNLFRYKKRFFMSIIGIAGSCALLVTGFGVRYSIFSIIEVQFGKIWHMDLQGFAYDPMPLADFEQLVADNEAAPYIVDAIYALDNICEAGSGNVKESSVHVFAAQNAQVLSGKITLMHQGKGVELTDGGVVITQKLADLLSLEPGDTVTIYNGTKEYGAHITGVTENYVYNYIYMTAAYYEELFGKEMQYNEFLADYAPGVGAEQADAITTLILADQRMYAVNSIASLADMVTESLSILDYIVLVLIVGSALLTFVVMLNLTNINIGERMREMATLRVLGFYDSEMYDYIFRENNALAIIGASAGLLLGKYLHAFIIRTCEVDMVMFVREAGKGSYILAFFMTLVFSLMVNLMMRRKVRSIDMVQSLKSAE